jgi:hypothetical protein
LDVSDEKLAVIYSQPVLIKTNKLVVVVEFLHSLACGGD